MLGGARPASVAFAPDSGPRLAPRLDTERRLRSFAVEDAIASLCSGAAIFATGPDLLDERLLGSLGQAAWRSIHEYRTLLRAAWTSLDACPDAEEHDRRSETALEAARDPRPTGPAGAWRHVLLVDRGEGPEPVEISVHQASQEAAATLAVARATDDVGIHWVEPAVAVERPML